MPGLTTASSSRLLTQPPDLAVARPLMRNVGLKSQRLMGTLPFNYAGENGGTCVIVPTTETTEEAD